MPDNNKPLRGDIQSPKRGDVSSDDFMDWDNPEDFDDEDWEDAPEGYYDEEGVEFEDGSYVPGPEDPDYDLSEAAGYAGWDEPRRDIIPQWVVVAVSMVLILSFVGAIFIRLS